MTSPPTEDFGSHRGGLGGLCGGWENPSLSDLALLRKAIKQDWPVPPERRGPLMAAVLSVLSHENRTASLTLAACRVALAAEEHSLKPERPERRVTVEECLVLPAPRASMPPSGVWRWEKPRGAVGYSFDPAALLLRLHYSVGSRRQRQELTYPVQVAAEPTRFGGSRWWFRCPLEGCDRRVRKLYLPPGDHYFGCRHCHGLTYTSRQGRGRAHRELLARPSPVRPLAAAPPADLGTGPEFDSTSHTQTPSEGAP